MGDGDVRFTVPEQYNEKLLIVDDGTGVLFENIDIDLTASGATPGLHLGVDDDLQIHDVEFIGQGIHPASIPRHESGWNPGPGAENGNPTVTNALTPIVRSSDGTGHVKNVVAKNQGMMGAYNAGDGRVGIWVGIQTEGSITFQDCQFEEFPNNGCYTSRTYGVVDFKGGTYRNNDISQVRIGSPGSSATSANIVVDAEASDSPNPYEALNQRGVRVEMGHNYVPTDVTVNDCDIAIRATSHSGGGVTTDNTASQFRVENTRIAVDVDGIRGVLAKFPDGGAYPPPPEPYSGTLRNVSITGSAAANGAIQLRGRPDSVVEGCCIHQHGGSRNGVRCINSAGSAVRNSTIDVTGQQVIERNGWVATSNIADNGSCPAPEYGTSSDLPHTLSIESNGGRYSYTFSVSGDIEKREKADPNDTVTGSTATGQGGDGGIDRFGFSGEIVTFELDGDATVYLDGERVDPTKYPDNVLAIDGNGSYTSYTVSVSGDLNGVSLTQEDTITRSSAMGAVGAGKDRYTFSGELLAFDRNGDATVFLNGERVNPARYPDNALAIDGDGSYTSYTFNVSGDLNGVSLTREDTITGSSATGAVGAGEDRYTFSGEILTFDRDGDAAVYLNGKPLDVGLPHTLSIASNGGRYSYAFSVSDKIGKGDAMGAADPNDTVAGNTATGQGGNGGIDSYAFSGAVTEFSLEGDATVYMDGEAVDIERFLPNTFTVDGRGSYTAYEFSTSGGVAAHGGLSREDDIDVTANSVAGAVGGGQDSYAFAGDIEQFSLDSRARIEVDRSARTISVSGTGRYASYRLVVTRQFRPTSSLTVEDSISGGVATGAVAGGTDTYRYTGEIQELTITDNASVIVS